MNANITKITADAKWRDIIMMKKFKIHEVTHCKPTLNNFSTLSTHDSDKIINLPVSLVVV